MPKIYARKPFPICTMWCYLIANLTFMLLSMPYVLTQYNERVHIVEPTPALHLQQKELTTVLLVSNEASDSYGRFHALRPEVGLLTSTARTFIQNGITTEYATQVVGTKLDNGRVYAQYLKKSSRVLYESPSLPTVVTSWVGDSTVLPQSHNDLYNADRPDWQDQDDRLRKVFVGNTDFIGELNQSQTRVMIEAAGYTHFPVLSSQSQSQNNVALNQVGRISDQMTDVKKLAAQKVLPVADLPTYTVKNNFSPSRFSWEDKKTTQENISLETRKEETNLDSRSPKLYHQQVIGLQVGSDVQNKVPHIPEVSQKRKLATTTYFGFADFTTIVGDSVIVFSPSSSSKEVHQGQVTSIKGEATLGDSHIPQVSYVPITVTEDLIVPTSVSETRIVESQTSKVETIMEYYSTMTDIVQSSEPSEVHRNDLLTENTSWMLSNSLSSTPPVLSRPSDEEVSAIFSLLQKKAGKSTPSIEPTSVATLGGATTIFFEEDPFANFVNPTSSNAEDNIALGRENITEITRATDEVFKSIDSNSNPLNMSTKFEKESTPTISSYSVVSTVVSIPLEEKTKLSSTITNSGVIIREIDNEEEYSTECMRTSQIFLTQLPKVISLLTTYFTIVDASSLETSSSIETSIINTFDIVETTKNYCIQSTSVSKSDVSTQTDGPPQFEPSNSSSLLNSTGKEDDASLESTDAPEESGDVTTISYPELDWSSGDGPLDEEDESGEEYELIYKTLYTTYTYLTTIFQESSSSILSRTEVITNVVSSTLGNDEHSVAQESEVDIIPTATLDTESKFTVLNNLNSIIREEEDSLEEKDDGTLQLARSSEQSDDFELNTFHTTYTYFTTIFTEGETEVISRTEVLTNVITVQPSKPYEHSSTPILDFSKSSDIATMHAASHDGIKTISTIPLNYSTMTRNSSVASVALNFEEYSSVTLVTDVRSSSSEGEGHIINDESKRSYNNSLSEQLIDDQISSESNTDEIIPSATLLLQTSFTTFTYYTTMYNNNNTNVVSRLETITNVVTETFNPTLKSRHIEEATLPVTYFTTFTYWTKLAKDGIISTLSREETISNVVTPSSVYLVNEKTSELVAPHLTLSKPPVEEEDTMSTLFTPSESTVVDTLLETTILEPTTYYTTYTYYTTSYESDNTITNSRFETVTNIVTPTTPLIPDTNTSDKKDSNSHLKSSSIQELLPKTELLLYDYKKIIDADGVSTLFFETQVAPSINENGTLVEITSSSSNLYIDELKKTESITLLSFSTNSDGSTIPVRQYKTGLVRLIEGTRIGNHTTTLYQSRVIGTLIDNRYAQIIESTSSFIFEKLPSSSDISPSKTEMYIMEATKDTDLSSLNPSVSILQSSTGDSIDTDSQYGEDASNQTNNDENDEQTNKATLNLQSKKPLFAPVIRPFASRNRPQFAPKKKTGVVSSATIITRSDFTPTITVTPALKSTNRYSSSRKAGIQQNNIFGQSSSRRFSRPGKSTTNPYQVLSTDSGFSSSSFLGGRNRFGASSRSSGNTSGSTRRLTSVSRSSISGSSNVRSGFSSGYNSNAKFRIKPTAVFALGQSSTSTEQHVSSRGDLEDSVEESFTQEQNNEEENETTTENSRRNQNPLLRFRRPLTRPNESLGASNQRGGSSSSNFISPRRNPLTTRAKVSTSTTTTTTTPKSRPRAFQRPTIAAFSGRQRPQNSLFPPRGLFQAQKQEAAGSPLSKDQSESSTLEPPDGDDDADYEEEEGEETEEDGSERKRRSHVKITTKDVEKTVEPVLNALRARHRSKREADIVYQPRSNFRNRFRRPKTSNNASSEERKPEDQTTPENSTLQPAVRGGRKNSRFGNKHHSPSSSTAAILSHRGIRPTRPNTSRAQFTLREKDLGTTTKSYQRHNAASFRRSQTTASSRRVPTSISSNRRLKSYANNNIGIEGSQRNANAGSKSRGNSLNAGRGRSSSSRGRNRNEFNMDLISNVFDGTLTVTHVTPSEVTIPVVNGQLTEYKNVITAKTSTEVLSPQQYTSFIGANGQPTLALTREESMTNVAGATEITQFILHGSATTTITFTPTTIRGRKTSFSHILPSTIYSVEKLVSTMQPQLANAPLANILLSQLLLGNIGLPGQGPGNALLGALTQPLITTQTQVTPLTEYRTHTSTYVTTIFEGSSTVLPITFQGKKIVTTVYDTTAQTITATEFITDTIISTPTQQLSQPAQVNSLLLQQLLLQHQIQPNFQQDIQSQAPLKGLLQPESNLQEIDSNNIQDREDDTNTPVVEETQLLKTTTRKKQRKPGKSGHKRNKPQGTSSLESSVITLYVSGRRPGEFSTVLSTVQPNNDSTLQKRQAGTTVEKTLTIDDETDFYAADSSDFVSEYILPEPFPGLKITSSQYDNHLSHNFLDSSELSGHTQTLESIVGDVSLWLSKSLTLSPKEEIQNSPTNYDFNASLEYLK